MVRIERLTHVGRINRVDVFVHWSVFAIALVMMLGVLQRPLTTLLGIACWMGVLLLHECGHMLVAQKRHSHVYEIELYPIFAICRFEQPWSRFDHALIAWGGVLAQATIAVPAILYVALFGYTPFEAANEVLVLFGVFSVAVAAFNLLPFEPLDGKMAWQILPAILDRSRRKKQQRTAGWRTYR